jgi:DNA-binding protein Fis
MNIHETSMMQPSASLSDSDQNRFVAEHHSGAAHHASRDSSASNMSVSNVSASTARASAGDTPTAAEATDQEASESNQSSLVAQLEQVVRRTTQQQLQADSTNIFEDVLHHVEAAMIATVLESTDHNITQASKRLGISRPTLRSKLRSRMPFK